MKLEDLDKKNIEIHYTKIYSVSNGKLSTYHKVDLYDKLTDEVYELGGGGCSGEASLLIDIFISILEEK